MNQKFMKEKPVMPLVISMALPMTFSMLVNALYNIIDSYFVARISEDAMTALSLVFPLQNLVNAVVIGFAIGINATIAYFLGAEKHNTADKTASLGTLFNMIHGFVLAVVCIAITAPFLAMFTDKRSIIEMGTEYAKIVFIFAVPNAAGLCFEKIFQSVGRMKTSMLCMLVGCVSNIILDPLMIFGIGIFPEMGIRGAALATGIGQIISLVCYLMFYILNPIPVKVRLKDMTPDAALSRKMYSIGVPATLSLALPSIQVSALNAILAVYSASYVLVLGAYFKLQTFLYLTGNGVVQGMRPLVGYNYGAGEKKRVKDIFRSALILIAGVMVIGTILCLAVPQTLIGLFTSNPETILYGKEALRLISIGFIASSVSVTVSGALEGLGKGKESLVISVLRYIIVILPLAFILSKIFGAAGVWHAFWVTEVIVAVISYVICKKEIFQ
ncbi:MATE family efflux transporter [Roseburia sp. AM23-20]|jgi:putative MATE family efflux protein|uniref:MATE family efflux transporter n=1 Tax=unclassified Roseburia TaxID=2637578 RepID=UPI000E549241|nr:MATE family efflux transporter [Roseburia sp. AM23-20]RHF94653.1 MATE family efflux transporter [Roseburia sp. AM23-20]